MPTVDQFIDTCRTYMGTRFRHQGRIPGDGLDCAGVVVCAAKELGVHVEDLTDYSMRPNAAVLLKKIGDHCDIVRDGSMMRGDLLVFEYDSNPQHIAVLTSDNPPTILHAVNTFKKVVEHGFDAKWKERLVGVYRIRDLEGNE